MYIRIPPKAGEPRITSLPITLLFGDVSVTLTQERDYIQVIDVDDPATVCAEYIRRWEAAGLTKHKPRVADNLIEIGDQGGMSPEEIIRYLVVVVGYPPPL